MKNKLTYDYVKMVFKLALPVMIQQFITAFASLIDNLMVGSNGKDAINAVGASGTYNLEQIKIDANSVLYLLYILNYLMTIIDVK
ncbi:MAG: hypothetical protein ACK5K7_03170 [Bacilli bacterium]